MGAVFVGTASKSASAYDSTTYTWENVSENRSTMYLYEMTRLSVEIPKDAILLDAELFRNGDNIVTRRGDI
jgi:hypothetical protein